MGNIQLRRGDDIPSIKQNIDIDIAWTVRRYTPASHVAFDLANAPQ